MSTNEELIGRAEINDLEAILAIANEDGDANVRAVKDNAEAIFTWDYEKGARPALNKLYEKAKNSQWNGETDLDWSIEVDQEANAALGLAQEPVMDLSQTCFRNWGDKEWIALDIE